MKGNLLFAAMLVGIIDREDYYNITGAGWGWRTIWQWLRAGKPQSWFHG